MKKISIDIDGTYYRVTYDETEGLTLYCNTAETSELTARVIIPTNIFKMIVELLK